MLAYHPGADGPSNSLSGNTAEWEEARTLPGEGVASRDSAPVVENVQAMHDEGFFHLRIKLSGLDDWDMKRHGIYVGFDVLGDELGNEYWPGPLSLKSDRGLETVVSIMNGQARMWQTESFRFWAPYRVPYSPKPRIAEVFPHILDFESNRWAWYEPIVETNRRRVGRDGRVYESRSWELNPLPGGSLVQDTPDYNDQAVWNISPAEGVVELRMPWILLGFVGPHQMKVLQAGDDMQNSAEVSEGVGVAVVLTGDTGSQLSSWPGLEGTTVQTSISGRYSWDEWGVDDITYHVRTKPVYYSLQDLFGSSELEPGG